MKTLTAKPGTGITLSRPGQKACRPAMRRSALLQEMRPLTKQHHWSCYWDRYNMYGCVLTRRAIAISKKHSVQLHCGASLAPQPSELVVPSAVALMLNHLR